MIITNIGTYYDNHPLDMYQREQPASVGTIFFYSDLILTDKSRDTQTEFELCFKKLLEIFYFGSQPCVSHNKDVDS